MEFDLFRHIAPETTHSNVFGEKKHLDSYFQTLVESLPGGVAVIRCGEDGILKPEFFTNGFAAMTGMTKEQAWELYGRDALAGAHPDDRSQISQSIAEYLRNDQKHCELTYRLVKGDGSYLWVKNTLSLIRYGTDGYYIYAVYHDITEERERQEELRKKYRDLILQHYQTPTADTLILGHCNITTRTILEIIDYTGLNLTKASPVQSDDFFSGLSGIIVDEKQRRLFLDCFLSDAALDAYAHGKKQALQECFIFIPGEKRGRYACFDMKMVETPDSNDITGILTVTDVTEKIMAEKILYNASVLNSDFVSNLDVFEDRYTVLSKHENTYCIPPDSGSHIQRMQYMLQSAVVPEDQEIYRQELDPEHILTRLKEEGAYRFVFSIYDNNGEISTKSMTVSPIDLKIGRVCLVRTDITELLAAERKSKEALERALEEAKKANQAKSDFLSRMSHDIRTPLNGVIGMAEIALAENTDPRLQADLETISSSGKFLLSLINDILDISRIESGKMELHPAPVPLASFDHMIGTIIRPLMTEKNITFDYQMNCGLQCAMLDEVRFNQIFFNLLSNAAKFTPENGHIVFSAEALSSDEKIEWVRFFVKDNGIGMSRDFLEKAFEPFEQMSDHGYGTQQRQGFGLGLAIVRELVSLMGGKLSVDSEPGKGSTFQVDLPMEKCSLPGNPSADPAAPADECLAGMHVLLVEDNEINRLVAARMLEAKSIEVTYAANGKEALETYAASIPGAFDAILMDVRMPVMDGLEATKRIRALKRADAKTIPILAMSANAYEEDRQMSLRAGMNDHLSKPVEPEKLYRALCSCQKTDPGTASGQ